jgi:hypothetical protein
VRRPFFFTAKAPSSAKVAKVFIVPSLKGGAPVGEWRGESLVVEMGVKTETPNELCSSFGVLLSPVLNTLAT